MGRITDVCASRVKLPVLYYPAKRLVGLVRFSLLKFGVFPHDNISCVSCGSMGVQC